MKKILLIFLLSLLIAPAAHSQLGRPFAFHKSGEAAEYDADAVTFWTSFGSEPSTTDKNRINTLFVMLKDSAAYDSIEFMWGAVGSSTDSRYNWVDPSDILTPVNTPNFTAYEGWTGNGSNMYLNLGINLSTASLYSQNSGGVFLYCRTNSTDGGALFGAVETGKAVQILPRYTDNKIYSNCNDASGNYNASNTDSRGAFVVVRRNSSATETYINSVSKGTAAITSSAPPNLTLFALCRNNSGSPALFTSTQQLSFIVIGTGWSSTLVRKITNCIEYYMDSYGKGVIAYHDENQFKLYGDSRGFDGLDSVFELYPERNIVYKVAI